MLQGNGNRQLRQMAVIQADCPKCGSTLFIRVVRGTSIPVSLNIRMPPGAELIKGNRMETICLACQYYQLHESEGDTWKLIAERQGGAVVEGITLNASEDTPQPE